MVLNTPVAVFNNKILKYSKFVDVLDSFQKYVSFCVTDNTLSSTLNKKQRAILRYSCCKMLIKYFFPRVNRIDELEAMNILAN